MRPANPRPAGGNVIPRPARRASAASVALTAALLVVAACGTPPAPRSSPAEAAAASGDTLTATIRSVEPAGRTLDLITGRGFALRVLELRVPPTVSIVWNGEEVPLTAMRPGYIVRVRYRETASGMVAERIEEITDAPSDPPYEPPE